MTRVTRVNRWLAALLVAVAAVLLPAAPANAAVTRSTSSSTLVLYPSCRYVPINYSVQATPDVSHWNMTIDVLAPDGTSGGGEFLSSFLDPTAGTFQYFLCGSAMPGTWTVVGTGEYEGGDGLSRTWQMTPSTFQVRAAHSRTQLKKKALGKGVYSLKVTVKDERPNGYYGTTTPQ